MNILGFILILSLMLILHELGHFVTARMFGITVQEFGIGLPPRVAGFRRGGVLYSLNLIPFGAFVKMLGEEDPTHPGSFASKPKWVRAIVLAAGSIMNFLLAVAAFTMMGIVGVPGIAPDAPAKVAEVGENTPAAGAGLQSGDVVVAFNGQPVNLQQFREQTQRHLDQQVTLRVERSTGPFETTLTPRSNPPEGQGAMGIRLDVTATTQIQSEPPLEALGRGFQRAGNIVVGTLTLPAMLIEGRITPDQARLTGLPGMAKATSETIDDVVDTGVWYPLFAMVGVFSAGLSVANMLPIPALDGGRLLFVIIEWIRGKRIAPEREAAYHFVGIVLLLALMLAISANDILSPAPRVDWGLR